MSIFERVGGTYTEKGGILYPNIQISEEETEAMQNSFSGKMHDKKYSRYKQKDILAHKLSISFHTEDNDKLTYK